MLDATLGLPVIMITSVSRSVVSAVRSSVIPGTPLMYKSQRTMSKRRRLSSSSASSPRPTKLALYRLICSMLAHPSRSVRSSSMTST